MSADPMSMAAGNLTGRAGVLDRLKAASCGSRLTGGKSASKMHFRLTSRGRSSWPIKSGWPPIRTITDRIGTEWRARVELCCKGLFGAVCAERICHCTMKVGLAVAWFISAMLRFAITDAPDVNRSGFNQLIHRHTVMGSVMPLHLVLDEKLEKTVMSLWKLPSNSGWNMTSWILRDTVKVGRKNYLLVEVVFTGKYWDRVKLARKNFSATD